MLGPFRRLKVSLLLDKAYQAAAYARYEEALKHLEAAEVAGLSRYTNPWTRISAQAYLLKAFLQIQLHRHEDALKLLIDLQKFFLARDSQTPDLVYLECYASVLAGEPLRSRELRDSSLAMRGFELFKTPYDAVSLDAVPAHLKRKFPLPGHPGWTAAL